MVYVLDINTQQRNELTIIYSLSHNYGSHLAFRSGKRSDKFAHVVFVLEKGAFQCLIMKMLRQSNAYKPNGSVR